MVIHCPKCYIELASQRDLERHLDRKTPCDSGEHKCNGCGLSYKTKKSLNDHKKRCKGKSNALKAAELAQENEKLKRQAEQHEQLLQMTNSVTAAASASQITNVGTQNIHNHITVNIHNHTHVSNLGEERLTHFSRQTDEEMLTKLNLSRCPKALEAWCALLRADEEHPENHNALLLGTESEMMACCRGGKWCWGDTEQTLLEISRNDMNRLYTHLGRYDQNQRVQDFRNEYLVHDVMARATSGMDESLKPIMNAVALPIIALTQKFYACTVEENMDFTDKEMHKAIAELEKSLVDEQENLDKKQAGQKSALLMMKRLMAEKAQQNSRNANNV